LDLKALGAAWRGVAVLPPRRQLAMLAAAIAALLVAALWLAWAEYREAHFGEDHLAAAGEMRTLSQRLAKSALRSLRGDPDAFPLVQASRDGFAAALARLARDGRAPTAVQALATQWERSERNATTLLRDQKLLTALAAAAGIVIAPIWGLRPHVGVDAVVPAFLIIVLGGVGSYWGAVIAGILVGLVVGLTGAYASEWSLMSMYILFILVVTFRARGLFGRKSALDA